MTILTIPAALVASIAIIYLLYIFAILSRKLGAVTKMKPYYRWLYGAMALVVIALVCEWILLMLRTAPPDTAPDFLLSEWFYLLGHTVPLLAAAMLALIVVLRYWGWLFRERER